MRYRYAIERNFIAEIYNYDIMTKMQQHALIHSYADVFVRKLENVWIPLLMAIRLANVRLGI